MDTNARLDAATAAMAPGGRSRALFVAPIMPSDHGNGLAMRAGFFLDAYCRQFDVDLAVIPVLASPATATGFVESRVRRLKLFSCPPPDSHFALVSRLGDPAACLQAFRRYARPSLAGFSREVVRKELGDWAGAEAYDVLHVFRLYLASVVEPWTMAFAHRPRLVIDCDEDDAGAYRRMADIERRRQRPWQAAWAEAEATAFATQAQGVLPRFDLALFASSDEAAASPVKVHGKAVVPNVAPCGARHGPRRRRPGKTIIFVGTMGYLPNDDGAHWLLTRVWPRLRRVFRQQPLRLRLVGSNPTAPLIRRGRQRNVVVTGAVRDVEVYYRDADLAVIPVRAGGGTRIKLLEAAMRGVPVVSTRFGAAGISIRHGRDLLLADNAEQFERACALLLRSPGRARAMAARARRHLAREYDADRWASNIASRVMELTSGVSPCRKS